MSSAYIKKYERQYHDGKQAPAPDEVKWRGKNKRARPFTIEYRWESQWIVDPQWRKWGTYRTQSEAEDTLRALRHKHKPEYYSFRLKDGR